MNLQSLVADTPEHCAAVIRQGCRSGVPSPARLRLLTSRGTELPCRCEIALLSPACDGAPALLWCRLVPQTVGNSHFHTLNHQIDALRREVGRRQEAESDLRQQREWLQTVLLGITDGVVATNLDGRVLLMNQVATDLMGWTLDEAFNQPIDELVLMTTECNSETAAHPVRAVLGSGGDESFKGRLRLVARSGVERLVQVSASKLMDDAGQICGSVLVLRSIDNEVRAELERQALEHQLRQSQKMEAIGTLAGGVAHDFNNVIGAVIANAALARMELAPEHAAQQSLMHVHRAADRARALVRQILAFSRREPQNLQRHWLQPLIEEAIGLLRGTLPARVKLEVACVDKPVYALVDAIQFQQVLMNLCTNAWHSLASDGGHVRVSLDVEMDASVQDSKVLLRVADDGCGMDDATRERIFEPFFTTKPVGEGTGLGLAVVHGIVAEHGGSLQVESALGQGSTFTLRLPALVDDNTEPLSQAESLSGEPTLGAWDASGRECHVAYVDDDELMLSVVERLLRRTSYRVSCYSSAESLLASLSTPGTVCDVVVTDFNMPDASGLDLAREVRGLYPEMHVVISSGHISDELRQGAEALGRIWLLNKEETFERLRSLLDEVVGANGAGA